MKAFVRVLVRNLYRLIISIGDNARLSKRIDAGDSVKLQIIVLLKGGIYELAI
jgi:hypothetical protein